MEETTTEHQISMLLIMFLGHVGIMADKTMSRSIQRLAMYRND